MGWDWTPSEDEVFLVTPAEVERLTLENSALRADLRTVQETLDRLRIEHLRGQQALQRVRIEAASWVALGTHTHGWHWHRLAQRIHDIVGRPTDTDV